MSFNRVIPNIMTRDLAGTRDFYLRLMDMHVHYDSDWYVILKPSQHSPHELGIIDVDHEIIPEPFRGVPQGSYLTFVVDNVRQVYQRAKELELNILEAPTDQFYGQRRMLLTDPNGLLLDISSPTPVSQG